MFTVTLNRGEETNEHNRAQSQNASGSNELERHLIRTVTYMPSVHSRGDAEHRHGPRDMVIEEFVVLSAWNTCPPWPDLKVVLSVFSSSRGWCIASCPTEKLTKGFPSKQACMPTDLPLTALNGTEVAGFATLTTASHCSQWE